MDASGAVIDDIGRDGRACATHATHAIVVAYGTRTRAEFCLLRARDGRCGDLRAPQVVPSAFVYNDWAKVKTGQNKTLGMPAPEW